MRSKVDPEKVRMERAAASYRAYAAKLALAKEWSGLSADAKEAWCCAVDEVSTALFAELDGEETFVVLLKLAMRDALGEDHITQLVTMFTGPGGLPGKIRLLVAPERISMDFGGPLVGRHDG